MEGVLAVAQITPETGCNGSESESHRFAEAGTCKVPTTVKAQGWQDTRGDKHDDGHEQGGVWRG